MKHFATALLGFGIMLSALPTARAADTTCNGDIANTTINGNVVVPTGQGCSLLFVTVTGNVQVQPNSFLELSASKVEGNVTLGSGTEFLIPEFSGEDQTVRIGGNLTVDHCAYGFLTPQAQTITQLPYPVLIVGGNVLIQYCQLGGVEADNLEIGGNFTCSNNSNSSECSLAFSNIKGNVEINNNGSAGVLDNTVGGNVAVNNNEFQAGVEGNTIGGNLQCQGNGQIFGSGNTVGGHKTGQCANF